MVTPKAGRVVESWLTEEDVELCPAAAKSQETVARRDPNPVAPPPEDRCRAGPFLSETSGGYEQVGSNRIGSTMCQGLSPDLGCE
jgi:hypothetical protein